MTLWDSTNRADGRSAGLVGLIYPSGLHVECFKNISVVSPKVIL